MRDPFVIAVLREYRWGKRNQAADRLTMPRALVDGVEIYDQVLTRVTNHDLAREIEEQEREAKRRNPGSFAHRRRPPSQSRRRRR